MRREVRRWRGDGSPSIPQPEWTEGPEWGLNGSRFSGFSPKRHGRFSGLLDGLSPSGHGLLLAGDVGLPWLHLACSGWAPTYSGFSFWLCFCEGKCTQPTYCTGLAHGQPASNCHEGQDIHR